MNAIPATTAELVSILRDMATAIEQGDSFEGSVEYVLPGSPSACETCHGDGEVRTNPSPDGDPQAEIDVRCNACGGTGVKPEWQGKDFAVRGCYRVGNSMGQGSVRLVGTV